MNQNPASNNVWEEQIDGALNTIDGEPMELEWNIFPEFTTLQRINKVQGFMSKMGDPSQFQGRIIFMSMFNDISRGSKENERECELSAKLVSIYAKRFSPVHEEVCLGWKGVRPGVRLKTGR